jgi:hypothetical protein
MCESQSPAFAPRFAGIPAGYGQSGDFTIIRENNRQHQEPLGRNNKKRLGYAARCPAATSVAQAKAPSSSLYCCNARKEEIDRLRECERNHDKRTAHCFMRAYAEAAPKDHLSDGRSNKSTCWSYTGAATRSSLSAAIRRSTIRRACKPPVSCIKLTSRGRASP